MEPKDFIIDEDERYVRHCRLLNSYLPHTSDYGYYGLHSLTDKSVMVNENRLRETFLNPGKTYSETVNLASETLPHQFGYTKSYKVKIHPEERVKSQLVTCYFDGYIVSDGYLDIFIEGNRGFNPNWFIYKVQRHLELTKEVLSDIVSEVLFAVTFQSIEKFAWELYRIHHISGTMPYTGYYENIIKRVSFDNIHDRDKWNIKMELAEETLKEVARIFGMDKLPQKYWDDTDEILYSKGFNSR